MDRNFLLFLFFAILLIVYSLLNPDRCPKCKAKLKIDRIKDPWGFNITKMITIRLGRHASVDTYYICTHCGKEYIRKGNYSKIEPL